MSAGREGAGRGGGGGEPQLADEAARTAIEADLDANILVEAGAGSGKTRSLVRRMLALIRTGRATTSEIAAVTFTRKAAGELRERFQVLLERELAAARDPSDPSDPARRLGEAYGSLDQLFIGTIHSFCARLLRERPLDAGLDPAFRELTEEASAELSAAFWVAHLERLAADSAPILAELADVGLHPARLEGLFAEVSMHPDVEFPAPEAARPCSAEIAAVRTELVGLIEEAEEIMPSAELRGGWDALQSKLHELGYSRRVVGWESEVEFLRALSRLARRQSYKVTQNRWSDAAAGKARAKALGEEFSAFVAEGGPARRLLARWRMHRYPIAIRMVSEAAEAWAAERKRAGRLDFGDLLMLSADLLRRSPRARRELGRRYRRVLVDEFQDTDPVQAEILMLLASEPGDVGPDAAPGKESWLAAEPRPGALFVVGDPKQSIYRFRRADIAVYNAVKDRFGEFGRVLGLETNFRSVPAVAELVNEVFGDEARFPSRPTPHQAEFAPLLPHRPPRPDGPDGVFHYRIPSGRRDQMVATEAAGLATWITGRLRPEGDRSPGDFLILTRYRRDLEPYARELEARGVPVALSGVAVSEEEELTELIRLLECLADPRDPVKLGAVLVGLFFGLDFEQLLDHRAKGGRFGFTSHRRQPETEVTKALRRLNRWWEAGRRAPADGVLAAIVDEIGLLPHAASGPLGSFRTGALLYALDQVASSTLDGGTSMAGALEAVRLALEAREPEAPLQPDRSDAVRVMNLHKAKGLEAPVVVLAAPVGETEREPERHVARTDDGGAAGYLVVQTREQWTTTIHAMPPGWPEHQAEERRFQEAEDVRLMYVAATRAEDELIVARRDGRVEQSPWALLDPWLRRRGVALDPIASEAPPDRPALEEEAPSIRARAQAVGARRRESSRPRYRFEAATSVAKRTGPGEVQLTLGFADPAGPDAAGPSKGLAWGAVVHGALAAAAAGPPDEELRAVCRALLLENERPLDPEGEPAELDELVALVREVYASSLWDRARVAHRTLIEVPFAARVPELDERRGRGRRATSCYVEGVIDLAFLEVDGWTIVDYKTDVGTDPGFVARQAAYRRQVELYATCWSRLAAEPVKERIIFYTTQRRKEVW